MSADRKPPMPEEEPTEAQWAEFRAERALDEVTVVVSLQCDVCEATRPGKPLIVPRECFILEDGDPAADPDDPRRPRRGSTIPWTEIDRCAACVRMMGYQFDDVELFAADEDDEAADEADADASRPRGHGTA